MKLLTIVALTVAALTLSACAGPGYYSRYPDYPHYPHHRAYHCNWHYCR
jgi:hypothetical protein